MLPKEEAINIYSNFRVLNLSTLIDDNDAIKMAIMFVERIIKEYQSMSDLSTILVKDYASTSVVEQLKHWYEVKEELINLKTELKKY
jgi:hypothetical protein